MIQGPANRCNSESVGPDELVSGLVAPRLVEYGWLRAILAEAAAISDKTDGRNDKNAINKVDLDLYAAAQRLRSDLAASVSLDSSDGVIDAEENGKDVPASAPATLKTILARSEFHHVTTPSLFDRAMQRVFEWLDRKLQAVGSLGAPSKAFVRLIVFGSVLVGLTLLAWWEVRTLRRKHVKTDAPSIEPNPQAASATGWRERMKQAQALAAVGEWRQAVHHTYWAAISRLEARGNWPADRSRTPREYLLLLPAEHSQRADLLTLTRSFERVWYGRVDARQQDFDDAVALLDRIGNK